MFELKITVATGQELIDKLRELLAATDGTAPPAKPAQEAPKAKAKTENTPPPAPPYVEPEATVAPPAPRREQTLEEEAKAVATAKAETKKEDTPTVSEADTRSRVAAFIRADAGNRAKVKTVLAELGDYERVGDVPADKRAEFLERLGVA